ncbi:hypothetical protein EMGBS15_13170 [Filimonas sp.]|nr:hypothetical protein EMGBS15_13170 [Filimonas sp.]
MATYDSNHVKNMALLGHARSEKKPSPKACCLKQASLNDAVRYSVEIP